MALKSYDSLLKQVQNLISNAVPGGVTIQANNVISDLSRMEASDYGYIIKGISEDLGEIIESRIISGLYTTATIPPSNQILVTAGKGTAAGKMYELLEDVTLTVNFDDRTSIYYVVIYGEQVFVTVHVATDQCKIAKIVVPEPGATSQIVDDKPSDGYDAWIVSARDIVFDEDQEFDDDSVEKLRSVIGVVLADNIIGNIRLSENLKITNTQGTVELDSNSLQIKDFNQNVLAKFNKDGTYFYDPHGVSLAKFTSTEAFIGNILITKNSVQTRNFSVGSTGFQIKDDGNVEFNDGVFRGTLSANVGNIGGWTLDTDSMYATTTGIIKTGLNVGAGYNGVILDKDGIRVYDDVLGEVVNLPSDGSAPSFSSGIIEETIFEINTNAILRTSEYVGLVEADTDLLIHFDGADAATAYTAETGQTVTFAGTAQLDTAQKKFGSASLLLDGNSDYLTVPDSSDWAFGTGDFTVETRVRFNSVSGEQDVIGQSDDGDNWWYAYLHTGGTAGAGIVFQSGGTRFCEYVYSGFTFTANTWYHIAFVRGTTDIKMYVNGTELSGGSTGAATDKNFPDYTSVLTIGARPGGSPGINGWIDELRISKGVARWTADFTPQSTAYESNDSGILINNTGIYGCNQGQTLANANFKVLATGNAYFKGEIQASTGQIGNVTITSTDLSGGLINGATIRGSRIETSENIPKTVIDNTGIYYQVSTGAGAWGSFLWGDSTIYGTGNTAHLFKEDFPILAILSERDEADIRFYDRIADPIAGTHAIGDIIMTNGRLKSCAIAGSPGIFSGVGIISPLDDHLDFAKHQAKQFVIEQKTSDPDSPEAGQIWIRMDL